MDELPQAQQQRGIPRLHLLLAGAVWVMVYFTFAPIFFEWAEPEGGPNQNQEHPAPLASPVGSTDSEDANFDQRLSWIEQTAPQPDGIAKCLTANDHLHCDTPSKEKGLCSLVVRVLGFNNEWHLDNNFVCPGNDSRFFFFWLVCVYFGCSANGYMTL